MTGWIDRSRVALRPLNETPQILSFLRSHICSLRRLGEHVNQILNQLAFVPSVYVLSEHANLPRVLSLASSLFLRALPPFFLNLSLACSLLGLFLEDVLEHAHGLKRLSQAHLKSLLFSICPRVPEGYPGASFQCKSQAACGLEVSSHIGPPRIRMSSMDVLSRRRMRILVGDFCQYGFECSIGKPDDKSAVIPLRPIQCLRVVELESADPLLSGRRFGGWQQCRRAQPTRGRGRTQELALLW